MPPHHFGADPLTVVGSKVLWEKNKVEAEVLTEVERKVLEATGRLISTACPYSCHLISIPALPLLVLHIQGVLGDRNDAWGFVLLRGRREERDAGWWEGALWLTAVVRAVTVHIHLQRHRTINMFCNPELHSRCYLKHLIASLVNINILSFNDKLLIQGLQYSSDLNVLPAVLDNSVRPDGVLLVEQEVSAGYVSEVGGKREIEGNDITAQKIIDLMSQGWCVTLIPSIDHYTCRREGSR